MGIYEDVSGNRLNLSIVGVRALNRENLATKKSPELFRLAVSFKNTVCCNMCVFTDGYKDDIKVMSTKELFRATLELLNNFNAAKNIHLLQTLGDSYLNEHVFGGNTGTCVAPKAEDVAGFDEFIKRYAAGLAIEHAAVANLK